MKPVIAVHHLVIAHPKLVDIDRREDVTTAQRLTIEGDFFAIHRVETPTEIDAAEGDAGHDATFAFFFAIFFFGLTGLGFPLLSYRFGRARDISRSDFG
jgi:hypothetical protein